MPACASSHRVPYVRTGPCRRPRVASSLRPRPDFALLRSYSAVLLPPLLGSPSPCQPLTQVRALASLAPRRSVCSANSSATSTATPPTLAQRRDRHLHTHSLSSTNSTCRALERAFRFFRRCDAVFTPVSPSRSRHHRRSTQPRSSQVRALAATTALVPAPHTALAANRNRLASVASRLPPCSFTLFAGQPLVCTPHDATVLRHTPPGRLLGLLSSPTTGRVASLSFPRCISQWHRLATNGSRF